MKKFTLSLLSTLLLVSLAAAQPPQGRGPRGGGAPPDPQQMLQHRIDRLTEFLGLSDSQKSQATAIFSDTAKATQPLREQMQDTRKSLSEAVRANQTSQIDTLAAKLGTLTGQITAIDSKAEAQFIATLTADQVAKLPPGGLAGGPGFGGPRFGGPGGMRRPPQDR